jgi:hypothetical protein
VKTGVQKGFNCPFLLDSGFRRNDGKRVFPTFYESIKVQRSKGYNLLKSLVLITKGGHMDHHPTGGTVVPSPKASFQMIPGGCGSLTLNAEL